MPNFYKDFFRIVFRAWVIVAPMLAGLSFVSLPLKATSVVALVDVTNHRLIIAADCRVNRRDGSVSECKIIAEPRCVAAIAGFYQDDVAGFQLRALVHEACQQPGDLRSRAEAFVRISQAPYKKAIDRIREDQSNNLSGTGMDQPVEVVFAGVENGQLALFVRGLKVDSDGRVAVERLDSTGDPSRQAGYFLGLNGHIRAYIKAHPDWIKKDYLTLAHQFVEMEINEHPNLASLPISELEIDEGEHVHWSEEGVCRLCRNNCKIRDSAD